MTERPIIFSAPMVRAILAGTKTQTRRVCRHQHDNVWVEDGRMYGQDLNGDDWPVDCPYGEPGDTLWVRETIRLVDRWHDGKDDQIQSVYVADGAATPASSWPWKRHALPSIHCPRGLSRSDLRVTAVRVERLQEISYEDACAEGLEINPIGPETMAHGETWEQTASRLRWPQRAFEKLWDSLNAKRAPWASNPWVWCISFERIES